MKAEGMRQAPGAVIDAPGTEEESDIPETVRKAAARRLKACEGDAGRILLTEKDLGKLSSEERSIYCCMQAEPMHIEEIAAAAGIAVGRCVSLLLMLDLKGYVQSGQNAYYRKVYR